MQSDPRVNSILAWRYRMLADEALAYARAINDPEKRRIFEELADSYLKRAATNLHETMPAAA